MSKYSMYQKELPPNPKKLPVHPVWRGIGCILLVVVPIISFIASTILINNRQHIKWILIPEDIIIQKLWDPYILVKIVYALILSFVLLAIITIITFVTNRLFGPRPYGPVDVPPEKVIRKTKKRK